MTAELPRPTRLPMLAALAPRTRAQAVALIAVAGATAVVLSQLALGSLFADTPPTFGDLGGHVHEARYLRDHLLPELRISGWSPDWFGGYPSLVFYFPLPALSIAALSWILPYNVAFKVVAASGVIALPAAAYTFGRLAGRRPPASACLAVATVPLLFENSLINAGGSVAAAINGEFGYSIALATALLTMGVAARHSRTGGRAVTIAALLAITAVIHVVPALLAGVWVAALVAVAPARARMAWAATAGALAIGLVGFWLVPALALSEHTSNMHHRDLSFLGETLIPGSMAVVFLLALAGVATAIWWRDQVGGALAATAAAGLVLFAWLPTGRVWNGRLLALWFVPLCLLAGTAVAHFASAADDRRRHRTRARTGDEPGPLQLAAPLALLAAATALALPQFGDVEGFAKQQFGGYRRGAEGRAHQELIDMAAGVAREHGCGRVLWEFSRDRTMFTDSGVLLLLPHWTDGCLGSMHGLFVESSSSTPYVLLTNADLAANPINAQAGLPYGELDVARGVEHLRMLGVGYFMAASAEVVEQADRSPDLERVGSASVGSREWRMYRVRDAAIVEALRNEPVVDPAAASGGAAWQSRAVEWFVDGSRWDVPIADDGPDRWRRLRAPDETVAPRPLTFAEVSDIDVGDDTIRFRVDRVGVPVVVRASYFPNWRATGASGPWRLSPNAMVVVPTDDEVVLRFGRSPAEYVGWLVTLLALAVAVFVLRRRAFAVPATSYWRELTDDAAVPERRQPPVRTQPRVGPPPRRKRTRR